ncbi:hypothetical protein HAX54_019554 [Datura stramonium]|uniref:Uncharacterized protein n=1 Tax=Datura stramonium TaxID=4076 RepID=A0ABS8URD7_DATST|nr:hypothetical protein [Datura stramonium]
MGEWREVKMKNRGKGHGNEQTSRNNSKEDVLADVNKYVALDDTPTQESGSIEGNGEKGAKEEEKLDHEGVMGKEDSCATDEQHVWVEEALEANKNPREGIVDNSTVGDEIQDYVYKKKDKEMVQLHIDGSFNENVKCQALAVQDECIRERSPHRVLHDIVSHQVQNEQEIGGEEIEENNTKDNEDGDSNRQMI